MPPTLSSIPARQSLPLPLHTRLLPFLRTAFPAHQPFPSLFHSCLPTHQTSSFSPSCPPPFFLPSQSFSFFFSLLPAFLPPSLLSSAGRGSSLLPFLPPSRSQRGRFPPDGLSNFLFVSLVSSLDPLPISLRPPAHILLSLYISWNCQCTISFYLTVLRFHFFLPPGLRMQTEALKIRRNASEICE